MKKIFVLLLCLSALLSAACLGHSPGEVYFEAYTKDGSGYYTVPALYRTRDNGQTAQVVIENFDGFIYRDAKPGSFYKRILGQGFYYSADTCETWTLRTPYYTSFQSGTHEGEIWGGVGYLSQDFGQSWITNQLNGLDTYADSWSPGLLQGELFVFTHSNKLYRSIDYGNNFTFVSNITIPNTIGVGRGWQPGELLLTTFVSETNCTKLYQSLDYGQNFFNISMIEWHHLGFLRSFSQGEYITPKTKRFNYPNYTMEIKFYRSVDYGATWDSVLTNYNNSIANNEFKINGFNISNYPNPFNNSTLVSFTIPKTESIKLSVYNASGQMVRGLLNCQKEAGNHQVAFDAGGLNSGIYYIRLTGNNISQIKKCILLK